MSRAALLPTPGDPFLLTYWLDLYKNRWADKIDALYVLVNSDSHDLTDYFNGLDYPNLHMLQWPSQIEHGAALKVLLEECKEDYIMLIEDDAFIFNGSEVDRCFQAIEDGTWELIGSKRGCTSSWLINQENQTYGLSDVGITGDTGPNFWPNFLFTKRETLLATDRDFGAHTWNTHDWIPGIPAMVQDLTPSDTFVWASIQLRNMGLKIAYVNQYHAAPEDLEHHARNYNIFDGNAHWLHAGSLSSGFGSLLSDRPLPPGICNTDMEKKEIERRLAFWEMFIDHYFQVPLPWPPIFQLAKQYKGWIDRLYESYKLDKKHVDRLKRCYRELMSWT